MGTKKGGDPMGFFCKINRVGTGSTTQSERSFVTPEPSVVPAQIRVVGGDPRPRLLGRVGWFVYGDRVLMAVGPSLDPRLLFLFFTVIRYYAKTRWYTMVLESQVLSF